MNTCFHDWTVLVTGAASRQGAVICQYLAKAGATVIAADLDGHAAQAIALSVEGKACHLQMDVTDPDSVRRGIARIVEHHHGLHGLVNVPSVDHYSTQPTADCQLDDWHRLLGVSVHGVFYTLKYAIPAMLANGGGAIVNLADYSDRPDTIAELTVRHALLGITRQTAQDYAAKGLRINAIGPGFVGNTAAPPPNPQQGDYAHQVGLQPAGPLHSSEELAELACYLLSSQASAINGTYYLIDSRL